MNISNSAYLPDNDKTQSSIAKKYNFPSKLNLDKNFYEAGMFVIEKNKCSIAMLQRVFHISFDKAVNLIDQLELYGVIGPEEGVCPRKILLDVNEFGKLCENIEHQIHNNTINRTQITLGTQSRSYDLMDGHDFEYFCADILKKNGFISVEVTTGSGDHGIDILAEKDDISYAIQCKCYSDNVGNSAVQQAHSGKTIYNKDIAVVMTNRYFTQQAIEEANKLGVKLWDRNKIETLIQNIS